MLILSSGPEYDCIRGALGVDTDTERQLSDNTLNEFQFLPAAEAAAIARIGAKNFSRMMALDPSNPSLMLFKAATVALTCSLLCSRLKVTFPIRQKIDDLGEVQRIQIDWDKQKQEFRNDANYFFGVLMDLDGSFIQPDFPPALATANGRVTRHDPQFHRNQDGFSSDFLGYVGPSGIAYNFYYPEIGAPFAGDLGP